MKVALYCRVSTDEQRLNGYSIRTQLQELRQYAKEHNYSIVGEYLDEGYSGGLLHRPALDKLLNDIKLNKIELVLFVKLDRWFRSVAHYYKIQEILEEHNVNWSATQEDYETITSGGKFKVNIMLSVSQQFKDATSERVSVVNDYKVQVSKEVITGKKIYGYDIVNKHYVINEEEAAKLKELFKVFIDTNSIQETYRWHKENITPLHYDRVKDRLKNKKYTGVYNYKGVDYYDYIPQIIDVETFNKVQEIFKRNIKGYSSSRKRYYIYSGLVKCGVCGSCFSGTYHNNKNTKYYRCNTHLFDKDTCSNLVNINELELERIVLYKLIGITKNELIKIKKIEQKNNKVNNIPKINSKIQRLKELYIDGDIEKSVYNEKLKVLQSELELEKKKFNIIDKTKLEFISSGTFRELYDKLDDEHKTLFNRDVIKSITIYNRNKIEIELVE